MTDYKDENGYPFMEGLPVQEEKQEAPEPPDDIFLNWCSMDLRPLREHAVWSEQDAEGFSTNSSQGYFRSDKSVSYHDLQELVSNLVDLFVETKGVRLMDEVTSPWSTFLQTCWLGKLKQLIANMEKAGYPVIASHHRQAYESLLVQSEEDINDLKKAEEAFKDFEKNGGKELAQVKQELGIDDE